MELSHPLGLAAGVDKAGKAASHWGDLGFSFAEIGTVTAHGQPGNPRPRLFRVPEEKAIINRMGFNNPGSDAVAETLAGQRRRLPLGINIGKSKVTPNEEAHTDYAISYRKLKQFGSYVVINVSSPNTPGLRQLQEVDSLRRIVEAIRAEEGPHPPLLVKVAPDLAPEDRDAVVRFAHESCLAGIIATNTTIDRSVLRRDPGEQGGISGLPLRSKAQDFMKEIAAQCAPEMTLIGVGGLFTGQDLLARLQAGAHLLQVYSGWVYGGPQMPARALLELLEAMEQAGICSVPETWATARTNPE